MVVALPERLVSPPLEGSVEDRFFNVFPVMLETGAAGIGRDAARAVRRIPRGAVPDSYSSLG